MLAFLYCFLVSINALSEGFGMLGKDFGAQLISTTSNPFVGLLIGVLVTSIIQSSSGTTSIVVTLVASGQITVGNAIPIVMGANIGTTVTALLAAMALGLPIGIQVAFSHLIFNISGTCVFYPLRFIPISLAKGLGQRAADSRLFALSYLLVIFFLVPLVILLLQKYVLGR